MAPPYNSAARGIPLKHKSDVIAALHKTLQWLPQLPRNKTPSPDSSLQQSSQMVTRPCAVCLHAPALLISLTYRSPWCSSSSSSFPVFLFLSLGLCPGCSLCLECSPPRCPQAHSLGNPRVLGCHFLSEPSLAPLFQMTAPSASTPFPVLFFIDIFIT